MVLLKFNITYDILNILHDILIVKYIISLTSEGKVTHKVLSKSTF